MLDRYKNEEMEKAIGDDTLPIMYRGLWLALAGCQFQVLGNDCPFKQEQLDACRKAANEVSLASIREWEYETQHEIVAHLRHFQHKADLVLKGAGDCLHVWATSCFVSDNADLIRMRNATQVVDLQLRIFMSKLTVMAVKYAGLSCIGYTHGQEAHMTTVGKRMSVWLLDLIHNLSMLTVAQRSLKVSFRGLRGIVGTNAAALEGGAMIEQVFKINELLSSAMGFKGVAPVTTQTSSRLLEAQLVSAMSLIAATLGKIGTDLRFWAQEGVHPKMSSRYVGSSAKKGKRNPIFAERMCGLARLVRNANSGFLETHATQWMERSLDDSSHRRVSLWGTFRAMSATIDAGLSAVDGLSGFPEVDGDVGLCKVEVSNFIAESVAPILMQQVKGEAANDVDKGERG